MKPDSAPKIHVKELKKSFKQLEVLKGVSVDVYEG